MKIRIEMKWITCHDQLPELKFSTLLDPKNNNELNEHFVVNGLLKLIFLAFNTLTNITTICN
jgi:hypothetical protein